MAEPGREFQAALQRSLGGRDIDEFLNSTFFGNLLRIDHKVVAKRRAKLAEAFGKIVAHVTWILRDGTDAKNYDLPTHMAEKEKAAVLSQWREMLGASPHRWPTSPVIEYLIDLSNVLKEVNKEACNAIELSDEARFASSSVTIFLPMKHEFLDIDRAKAYSHVKVLSEIVPETIQILCTPAYEWRIEVSNNITRHLATHQFSPRGFGEFLRKWAAGQINRAYLVRLGITNDRMDLTRLIISMGQEGTEELGHSMMTELLSRPDTVKKTLGKGAYSDLQSMIGALKPPQP